MDNWVSWDLSTSEARIVISALRESERRASRAGNIQGANTFQQLADELEELCEEALRDAEK